MSTDHESPKHRLLEAAVAVFADKGFAGASVRDICGRAGANIAAVNYYFGDKERLYIEAVKHAHCCWTDAVPLPTPDPAAGPELQLRSFINVTVGRVMQMQNPHATQLIMREMAQPTGACAELVRDAIRPMADGLQLILRGLLPGSTEGERYLVGFSVVGQCLFYKVNRPVARLLMGEAAFDALTVEQVANHIFDLTMHGIAARSKEGTP